MVSQTLCGRLCRSTFPALPGRDLPLVPVLIAIGIQTVVASQLGLALGRLIGERVRAGAERLAGLAFVALGIFLIAEGFI